MSTTNMNSVAATKEEEAKAAEKLKGILGTPIQWRDVGVGVGGVIVGAGATYLIMSYYSEDEQ